MPVIDEWTMDDQRMRLREDAFHYTLEVQAPVGWRSMVGGGALLIVGRRLKHVLLREDRAVAEECARIRRELLAWMRIERAEGRAMTPNRLQSALDRICPDPDTPKPG